MGEVPERFCGYEWPEDCERFNYDDNRVGFNEDDSHAQTTCVRETLPDTDRCAWHAASDGTEHKSVEALRDARVDTEIRAESELGESLDGAVLAGVEVGDDLELGRTLLWAANLSEAALGHADLSEAILAHADLSVAGLGHADLSEATLNRADLSEAGLNSADLSEATLNQAILTGTDLNGAKLSNLTVDRGTTVDGLAEPEPPSPSSALPQRGEPNEDEKNSRPNEETDPNNWGRMARAYHDLKTEFHDNGFVGKARRLHIGERRARRHETAAEVGWFNRQHLVQFVSGLFTGYGVGVWRLVGTMTALFLISIVTYALAGVADPVTYSTITFATSPPRPTGTLPIWARVVANIETFFGTLLIVSLGFVLGNREQF